MSARLSEQDRVLAGPGYLLVRGLRIDWKREALQVFHETRAEPTLSPLTTRECEQKYGNGEA